MKPDPEEIKKKLRMLSEAGSLSAMEVRYIERRIGTEGIPWFAMASVLLGTLAIMLIEANVSLIGSFFAISEVAALGALLCGIFAIVRREKNLYIAAIGIFLAITVLLVDISSL